MRSESKEESFRESGGGGAKKGSNALFTPLPITDARLKIQGLRAY
jgi:hypothetical protein